MVIPRFLSVVHERLALFRGGNRVVTEIVMPGAGNAHEALGRPDQAIQPLAERYGNNSVVLAVP